jgi:hypothetical protein
MGLLGGKLLKLLCLPLLDTSGEKVGKYGFGGINKSQLQTDTTETFHFILKTDLNDYQCPRV